MDQDNHGNRDEDAREFVRVPGLFRRWEIEQVLESGADYHLEEAGTASDGTKLFAVFRREEELAGLDEASVASCCPSRGTP